MRCGAMAGICPFLVWLMSMIGWHPIIERAPGASLSGYLECNSHFDVLVIAFYHGRAMHLRNVNRALPNSFVTCGTLADRPSRNLLGIILLAALIVMTPASALARPRGACQDPAPHPPTQTKGETPEETKRRRELEAFEKRQTAEALKRMHLHRLKIIALIGKIPYDERPFWPESKLSKKEKQLLESNSEDLTTYEGFLRLPDTGLFKLRPYETYNPYGFVSIDVLKLKSVILPIRGWGAYYSFTQRRHELDKWSEIGLSKGELYFGFTDDSLGLVTVLGDVSLESVTLETPAAQYMDAITLPDNYEQVELQNDINRQAFVVGGLSYSASAAAGVGSSYLLRSTYYSRADTLIAFRVIRQDGDGSLYILWKRLKSYQTPVLKRTPAKRSQKSTPDQQ